MKLDITDAELRVLLLWHNERELDHAKKADYNGAIYHLSRQNYIKDIQRQESENSTKHL